MTITTDNSGRKFGYLGMPWEDAYGYAQAVQVGDTIYVAGQVAHDDRGILIAPAPLDASGRVTDASNMAAQMRASYANATKLLAGFGATLNDVVEETVYVIDFAAAFAVAGPVRKEAFGTDKPRCASTIVGVTRLAFPEQLIEISYTVVLRR